jgi:endonuclease YncB( thermonuclease family)
MAPSDDTGTRHRSAANGGHDAPEKNQSFGTKSKDALAGLVFGKTVTVQSKGTDRYGRTLGVISVGDTNVNQKLVAGGWAWHYKQYSSDQTLARLESQAKSAGSGLWADANPLPPWDFRSRQRSGSGSAERPPKSSNGKRSPAQPPRGAGPTI